MGTVLVAGRVDESSKATADEVIRSHGLTASDVIRVVWDNIAKTGKVPVPVRTKSSADEVLDRFDRLRAMTPRSAHLETLSPEGVRDELSNRG